LLYIQVAEERKDDSPVLDAASIEAYWEKTIPKHTALGHLMPTLLLALTMFASDKHLAPAFMVPGLTLFRALDKAMLYRKKVAVIMASPHCITYLHHMMNLMHKSSGYSLED
jgi:hypothetical protein